MVSARLEREIPAARTREALGFRNGALTPQQGIDAAAWALPYDALEGLRSNLHPATAQH